MDNDLISRSALLKDREYCDCPSCEDGGDCGFCYIPIEAVENAPAVDAVEVVYCRECKHWRVGLDRTNTWCALLNGMETVEPDYCSYGERRDDDGQ